jgi:SNF2 family DNA or RNA helicase
MRQQSELRPYQQDITTFLFEHDEALVVARPGYGKTIAALTAIKEMLDDKVIRHALVIAPKRVARNVWPDEIAGWAHTAGLRYQILDGSPLDRLDQLCISSNHDLTIIGIDLVQWLMEKLDGYPKTHSIFDLLVLDEISRFRNPTGKRAKEVAKRASKWKLIWGLTGTLRPNGVEDIFMPARIVTRDKLWGRSFYKWQHTNMYPTDFNGYRWDVLPGREEILNAEIAPYIITPGDATLQLPKLTILRDYIELPPNARLVYDTMERKLFAYSDTNTIITAASAGVATGKIAQAANGFMYGNDKQVSALHDEKREWLQDTIESTAGPLLVIYEYLEDLKMIAEVVGEPIAYLGDGVSAQQTSDTIQLWNAGQIPLLAMHPASGGHGLNLQAGGADMAWISPCWSPEYWEQTIARLHRSGQTRPVMVRVCVARETVDELKLSRVHDKMTAQLAFEQYLRRRQSLLSR